MSLMTEKKYIDVLNCDDSIAIVPAANGRSYVFQPGSRDEPFVYPIPPEEVRYLNSSSNVFKNGILRFRENEAAEIYDELGIKNPEQLLFTESIDEMLLNPTMENMDKVIKIADGCQFERVRGRYYYLINHDYSIEVKVGRIIEQRYRELRAGKKHTQLVLNPVKTSTEQMQKELLQQQQQLNQKYAAALEELKGKYEALLSAVAAKTQEDDTESSNKKGRQSRAKKSVNTENTDIVGTESVDNV